MRRTFIYIVVDDAITVAVEGAASVSGFNTRSQRSTLVGFYKVGTALF